MEKLEGVRLTDAEAKAGGRTVLAAAADWFYSKQQQRSQGTLYSLPREMFFNHIRSHTLQSCVEVIYRYRSV